MIFSFTKLILIKKRVSLNEFVHDKSMGISWCIVSKVFMVKIIRRRVPPMCWVSTTVSSNTSKCVWMKNLLL